MASTRSPLKKLQRKLQPTDKTERCGILVKGNRLIESINIALNPEGAFEIQPELLVEHASELVGTWHTHPQGTAQPSAADFEGFKAWPQLTHYIVGRDGVRAYRVENGAVVTTDV